MGSEDGAICSPTNFSAVGRNGGYGCNRGIDSSTFGRGSESSVTKTQHTQYQYNY